MISALQFKPAIPSILATVALLCFTFLLTVSAVSPPPDGCYPGFTTAEGCNALKNLITGTGNTGVGWSSLLTVTTGSFNTGIGAGALALNTGDSNTAVGAAALLLNVGGSENTAVGTSALLNNITGGFNTAVGSGVLHQNTDGDRNTAVGLNALFDNTTGNDNTALGFGALTTNSAGESNTAVGSGALLTTTGENNTAVGRGALSINTSGGFNTAVGRDALSNSTGNGNIALGASAGSNVMTATNVICIGAPGADVSGGVFIGNVYLNPQPIVGMDPDSVTITSSGRLGRGNVSSRRYKHDIQPMDKASEILYALKPVSFRYNKEYDSTQTLAFGLIAEEVAEVYPDLVGRNPGGQPESVRYEQINAMLLNEFLKEHKAFIEEQKKVQRLEDVLATVNERLKEQEARIGQVSAQLEARKSVVQTVLNNP